MVRSVREELLGVLRHKIDRLDNLKNSNEVNDLIETAGLTRDLLLSDHNGLFGEAIKLFPELRTKRDRRFRFTVRHFATTHHDLESKKGIITNGNGKECTHPELKGVVNYSRDDLLKLPILCIEGGHYTYKDIIQFVANKLGSRHFDRLTGSEKQMLLHDIRQTFGVDDFDPVITALRGKAGIVVAAGRDLIDKLSKFI